MENTSPIPNMSLPQTSSAMASAASNGIHSSGGLTQTPITSPSKAKETASSSNNVKVVQGIADPRPEFKASVTSPLMQQQSRPPPPPIPPHLRPSTINMTTAKAPIARDESMHDLGDSKSPSLAGVNFHDFESPAGNGNLGGFIEGRSLFFPLDFTTYMYYLIFFIEMICFTYSLPIILTLIF